MRIFVDSNTGWNRKARNLLLMSGDQRTLHAACSLASHTGLARDLALYLADQPTLSSRFSILCRESNLGQSVLQQVIKEEGFFVVRADADDLVVKLDTAILLAYAKAATSTGILLESLPPPVALVGGKHPIRPGQPECRHWQKFGVCKFLDRCVFNHAVAHGAQLGTKLALAPTTGAPPAPPPPAAAPAAAPAMPGTAPPAISTVLQGKPLPASPPPPQQQQQQQLPQRPGQPACITFMLRGVCLSGGGSCPYDHPRLGPATEHPLVSQAMAQAPPPPPAAAAAALPPLPPAAAATTATTAQAAAAAAGASSSSAAAAATSTSFGSSPSLSPSLSAAAAAGTSMQRQQQLDTEQLHAVDRKNMPKAFILRVAGITADNLPLRMGASVCPFYSHTGTCRFGKQCIYTHPEDWPVPLKYAESGFMAAKFPAEKRAPYARLVSHLSRVWDYTSCPEAQIKTWMAKYLLAAGNPGCSMWSTSAARLAADDDDDAAAGTGQIPGKPYGRYSCGLSQAGELLRKMWAEQPGAGEAAGEMPGISLRALFASDAYFDVLPDPHNSSNLHLKLRFNKLKTGINW